MRRSIIKIIFWLSLTGIVAFTIVYGVGLFVLKNEALQSARDIKNDFQSAASAITDFNLADAKKYFESAYQEIIGLKTKTENTYFINDLIKELPQTFSNLGALSLISIELTADLDDLKNNAFHWLIAQKGNLLIEKLRKINDGIKDLSPLISQIKQQAALINYPLSDDLNSISGQLYNGEQILKTIIGWLTIPEPQRLLILFQNHSEIRPGGGFLGSYADVGLNKGSLFNLEVKDIYDIDGQLERKIVPPKPLQALTINWGARDANWFFDFPASAKKVIELLEASKFHQERKTNFAGAIAINAKVLSDILDVVGPIDLADYNLQINSENFLPAIQKEVEAGEDNKAGRPKTILQKLTPILFEKLGRLNEDQKKKLVQKLADRLKNKDIMIYFDDLVVESYLKEAGVAGDLLKLPNDFNGDYLAVVNANIGGGKTDINVKQKIILESDLSLSGKLSNELQVVRDHQENNLTDPWYKKDNKIFMQVMTPLNANLFSISGQDPSTGSGRGPSAGSGRGPSTGSGQGPETNIPERNYSKLGYETDRDLEAAETPTAFHRQNFSFWLTTKLGETRTVTMAYENDKKVDFDKPFTFIYEKQSGVDSALEYAIAAPIGYKWKESNSPVFKYSADNTPSRVIIRLNLAKP